MKKIVKQIIEGLVKRGKIIIGIIIILVFLAFLYGALWLYFNNLKDGCLLPTDRVGWGTFGDYLSGVFAMFNLGVVVLLTLYVSHKEELRDKTAKEEEEKRNQRELELQMERSEKELQLLEAQSQRELQLLEARSEKELEVQRKILLSELRFKEFEKIYELTTAIFILDRELLTLPQYILKIRIIRMNYLLFVSNKNVLFPILKEPETIRITDQIGERFNELLGLTSTKIQDHITFIADELTNPLLAFHTLLQAFIIKELGRG